MVNLNEIGPRIRQIRKQLNLTQEEFGKKIDKGGSIIGSYETCRQTPSFDTIIKIVSIYNISLNWLISGNGPIQMHPEDHPIHKLTSDDLLLAARRKALPEKIQNDLKNLENDFFEIYLDSESE